MPIHFFSFFPTVKLYVVPSRIVGVSACYLPLYHKVKKKIPSSGTGRLTPVVPEKWP